MEAKELLLMQSVRGIFRRQPGKEKKKRVIRGMFLCVLLLIGFGGITCIGFLTIFHLVGLILIDFKWVFDGGFHR